MPSITAERRRLVAALVAIAVLSGCSAVSQRQVVPPVPARDAVDVAVLDAHRTEYLGDASSVIALARAAGVGAVGDSTFALSTDRRPYVLTVELTSLADGVTRDRADQLMTDRAVLLLATIGNADEVRWVLPGGDGMTGVLTRADADQLAGAPVAELGATADGLDHLVQRLGR